MVGADQRLAVYGTLAPGRPNHHVLDGLSGRWIAGSVRGFLRDRGWGAAHGYPGMLLDPSGPVVAVDVLESAQLPAHWARLDEFEGPGYRRSVTSVSTAEGDVHASIYELVSEE